MIDFKRKYTSNSRQLIKLDAAPKSDTDFLLLVEKLTQDIIVQRQRVEEENKRRQKIIDNAEQIRQLAREENLKYMEMRQKHEAEIDFDELTDKKLEDNEKKYWKLVTRKQIIEEHLWSLESTSNR